MEVSVDAHRLQKDSSCFQKDAFRWMLAEPIVVETDGGQMIDEFVPCSATVD